MYKPLVSILIPVYNRENLVGDCIQSALDQTIDNIEIIVVDNASTDNTWAVCQEYARLDPRVRIFRNENNIGPVRNWQRCIDYARGKYGKILFSDDLIHREYLEKVLPMLDDLTVGFVFSRVCIGEEEWQGNDFYQYVNSSRLIDVDQYLKDCILHGRLPVSPGCALFRLTDLRKNLYLTIPSPTINDFEKHGAGPDILLFLLCAASYKNIAYVNETLVFFRSHPGSITISDKSRYLQKCYLQAKVWFTEQYQPSFLEALLIKGWLSEIKATKSLVNYKEFIGQYTRENINANFLLIVKVLSNMIMNMIAK